jgi:hypothetical protein
MFIQFTVVGSDVPLCINRNYIATIRQVSEHPPVCEIQIMGGLLYNVEGKAEAIITHLNDD